MRSTDICVVDDQGELLAEGKTDAEVADIIAFLNELAIEITEVGLEAGTLTQYLTYRTTPAQRLATTSTDCVEKLDFNARLEKQSFSFCIH